VSRLLGLSLAVMLLALAAGCSQDNSPRSSIRRSLKIARKSAAAQLRKADELDTVTRLLLKPDESAAQDLIDSIDILLAAGEDKEAWRTTGALATCGGPAAAKYLNVFYEDRTVRSHVESQPPFVVPTENVYGFLDHLEYEGWDRSATEDGGIRYTAFLDSSNGNPYDVRIAAAFAGNDQVQNILYTGLLDTAYYAWHWAPMEDMPQYPLKLTAANGMLTLQHHSKPGYLDPRSRQIKAAGGHIIVESTVDLDLLKLDSDGDGLTDIFEGILQTNSSAPDTDGDGLADAEDPHPLADYSAMGYEERGIARALSYLHQVEGKWQSLGYEELAGLPQKYCYFEGGNFSSVAWTPYESVYGICGSRFPKIKPQVYEFWLVDFAELQGSTDNPGFSGPEQVTRRFAEMEAAWAPSYVSEGRVAFVLDLQEWLGSYMVMLVDVEGELYPATTEMMSVS